jgi:hypothetical protein
MAECYLVLADKSADAVVALLRYLWRPENTYVLHADRKAPAALHGALAALAGAFGNVLLVPPGLCSWGGFSLVAAELAGLTVALTRDWTHLLIVSETHLPLRAPEVVRAALPPGRCLLDIAPFAAKPAAAGDLRHRIAYHYREVPGVGAYAAADRADPSMAGLWHGSQWMVLSRQAVILLAGQAAAIESRFGDVLLADEVALQTVLGEAGFGGERRPTVWAATAARGGDKDQILSAEGFFQAQAAQDYLFIRKRPATLPPDVAAVLAAFAVTAMPLLPAFTDVPALPDSSEFLAQLRWALAVAHRDVRVEAVPRRDNTPRCMIEFVLPAAAPQLTLTLLSEDFLSFKILLLWAETFDGRYETLDFFGLPVRLAKARVHGQFQQREIVLGPAQNHGFVAAAWPGDVGPVVQALGPYLAAFARLTKLVLEVKN